MSRNIGKVTHLVALVGEEERRNRRRGPGFCVLRSNTPRQERGTRHQHPDNENIAASRLQSKEMNSC